MKSSTTLMRMTDSSYARKEAVWEQLCREIKELEAQLELEQEKAKQHD